MRQRIFVALSVITIYRCGSAQSFDLPKNELRGVFLTTTNSLDWPKSQDKAEQQSSLRKIISDVKAANLNAIFFQARARGDAYYKSEYEPWAENLTGILGKYPGWDPLAFVLDEAHRLGIEVHAWFNVYKIRGQTPLSNPAASSLPHPSLAHPHWVLSYDKELWLDPGLPEVREYLIQLVMDVATKYDIDGICFDFIRYPGKDFADSEAYRRYGNGKSISDWRRNNINDFVEEAYGSITRVKPRVKVGAAPVGNFGGEASAQPNTKNFGGALEWFSQDAQAWLKNGWLDYLAPQVYWTLEFDTRGPDFAFVTRYWKKNSAGRHIYVSIGAYKQDIFVQIPDQIAATRKLGAQGQIFFRYENVAGINVFGSSYAEPATPPKMLWKENH